MKKKLPPKQSPPPAPVTGRVVTIGSGMTEKTYTVFDLNDAHKVLEHLTGRGSVVGKGSGEAASSVGYDREIAWARRTLEGAGFPTDPEKVYPSPDKRGTCILLHLVERSGKKEEAAVEWYAAKVLQCWYGATRARAHIEQGAGTLVPREVKSNLSLLARYMGELGEAVATRKIKFPWEKSALIGKRNRKTQSVKGGISGANKKTAAEEKWKPIREAARKIADERKGTDRSKFKSDIARAVQKDLSLSDPIGTIRKKI